MSSPLRRCPCCGLAQAPAVDMTGVTARVCAHCTHHQGEQSGKQLARAEKHERMLREWLRRCRESESSAQAETARARDEASSAREATASALRSRGMLAARVVEAADSGDRNAWLEIARDPDVRKWAREQDQDDVPRRRPAAGRNAHSRRAGREGDRRQPARPARLPPFAWLIGVTVPPARSDSAAAIALSRSAAACW